MRFIEYAEGAQRQTTVVKLQPHEVKNLQRGFDVNDEVSFDEGDFTRRLRIESPSVTDELIDDIWREVPQQPSSLQDVDGIQTYDDVLLAMKTFSNFFNDLKLCLENDKSASIALSESLERNNIKKALHTYDKHELVREGYK